MNSKYIPKGGELICIDCVNGISYIGKALVLEENPGRSQNPPSLIGLEQYVLEETKSLAHSSRSIKEIYTKTTDKKFIVFLRNIDTQVALQILDAQ